jgi:hypothetical protein
MLKGNEVYGKGMKDCHIYKTLAIIGLQLFSEKCCPAKKSHPGVL